MFSSSTLLSVLLIAALVGGVYLLLGATGRQKAKGSKAKKRYTPPPQARWKRRLPIVLLVGAVACLIAALAQFRLTQSGSPGAVMLTMDTSQSMNQTDVLPSRIEAAKSAAGTFLDQLPADFPVGLVTFADSAQVVVPPITDRQRISTALEDLTRGKGTVIGDGLETAVGAIERDWQTNGERPSAIVLLSDGRDTGSTTSPEQAAQDAAAQDIPVYTVVLGTATPDSGAPADVALLQSIAQTTGADSFTAGSAGELTTVYQDLGTQLSTQLKISNSAALFVAAAVVLAICAAIAVLFSTRREY